jgi:hypothetical protein
VKEFRETGKTLIVGLKEKLGQKVRSCFRARGEGSGVQNRTSDLWAESSCGPKVRNSFLYCFSKKNILSAKTIPGNSRKCFKARKMF